MDETDIQQIVEQRKESYDLKQIDKEFEASLLIISHNMKLALQIK
jgi:ABC-type dipeptide/oligopeptide/nickel transport system ATPase component